MSTDNPLERFQPVSKHRTCSEEPTLSIYPELAGYLNAKADELLGNPEYVQIGTDAEQLQLAFIGIDTDSSYSFAFSRKNKNGGDVSLARALRQLGIDADLDETQMLPLEEVGDALVADVSALLSGGPGESQSVSDVLAEEAGRPKEEFEPSDDVDIPEYDSPGTDSTEDSQPETEPAVADDFTLSDNQRAIVEALDEHGSMTGPDLKTASESTSSFYYYLRQLISEEFVKKEEHPEDSRKYIYRLGDTDTVTDAATEADVDAQAEEHNDDSRESSISLDAVRDCAESVDTIRELARLLDVSMAVAAKHAKQAEVYDDLEDNRPKPMGVGRSRGGGQ